MSEKQLLIVEDEKPIADILAYGFRREGFAVRCAYTGAEGLLRSGRLTISEREWAVLLDGERVSLTPKEFELLVFFVRHPRQVFSRDQLLSHVWGYDFEGDSRTVDVHVKRLREKLEGASDKWALKTVWGVGYKFEVKE